MHRDIGRGMRRRGGVVSDELVLLRARFRLGVSHDLASCGAAWERVSSGCSHDA